MARGFMARRYFRRLKAAYIVVQHYRKYKKRTYINELAQTFKDAKNMRDYGKHLSWPKENYAVRSAVPLLKMMYARWYSWMILRRIPREDWPQLRLKMSAASVLRSKRQHYGQDRRWEGNYLSQFSENSHNDIYNTSMNNLKNADHFKSILFSAFIKKTNKFSKQADRVMVVTEQALYKLESSKFKNMKKVMNIAEITGLSVSPGKDQLIIIHSNHGNDFIASIMTTEDKIGELVGILNNSYYQIRKSDLQVTVDVKFKCMLGNKRKVLRIEVIPEITEPTFKKEGENILFALPPTIGIIDDSANNKLKIKTAS